ncbi:hypothetical protein [Cellulomonas composti]|uniref:Uncharacterized protein n=1 Tax=Cellulomonas composti TaxID=266130 RepID=A0A511JAM5_9CELL|nr:hypothetical protein [Cellulomonas composti]GEL95037.1 hypothetical protein CCO02nite_16950 [Cellulomonas composti]
MRTGRGIAAGDAGLSADDSLTVYSSRRATRRAGGIGDGVSGIGDGRRRVGAAASEAAMTAVFHDGRDPISLEPLGMPYTQLMPGEVGTLWPGTT